ncbi:hypothetical protein OIE71_00265 [Streptomyces sp. NBC_01725]|uniref:hypothetical protein n=1 Tax=Streptomyces sp. NBC_01725 TaxID=2975923 RepID=UPI002E283340|nr:hypothetical protein [Streptomyces sp. NBC_01725]
MGDTPHPLRYDGAVLPGAMVRKKLRTNTEGVARTPVPRTSRPRRPSNCSRTRPPEAEHRETASLSALRALKKSRADVEALGSPTSSRADSRSPTGAGENDQRTHHTRQPDPRHGPEVGR